MLIPLEWLREHVELPDACSPEELAERLTATGNEIEEIRLSPAGPVLHLKATPNRADMLSIRGAAREAAALYDREARAPAAPAAAEGPADPSVRVDVESPALCPRYVARIIHGVRVGPSPEWLRRRLESVGLRSISTVVDVTNYVMFELGQPLHAFDLDLLEGRRIVVREARAGETLTAIDGTEVTLAPGMLVIADGARPVALAGVMGGRETEVSDTTTSILLESACFDPASVRRSSRRAALASPSSYRFERGVDPEAVREAADRAAALIAMLAGGEVSETVFDLYPEPFRAPAIRFRPERCRALLGVDVPDGAAEALLARLGVRVRRETPEQWTAVPPPYRRDLRIEEDLVEEVGRLYGYDRLPETLPAGASGAGGRSEQEDLVRQARELLLAQGLNEVVTNTLTSGALLAAARLDRSPAWPGEWGEPWGPVSLRNPLSEEFDTLRPSLLPGLLQAAQHNLRRGTRDVYLFEAGYAHGRPNSRLPQHRLLVSGLLLGSRWPGAWNPEAPLVADFYAAKGTVEALARGLGVGTPAAEPARHPAFHPGRTARLTVEGELLGLVGELHPTLAAAHDLPRGVYLFELDGELLLRRAGAAVRYAPPSRFPPALRDLAVVADAATPSGRIEAILRAELGEWARGVRLFDVYSGRPLPEGRVSLAYALELGAGDRTLTDAEVDARLEAVRARLREELGADFRS